MDSRGRAWPFPTQACSWQIGPLHAFAEHVHTQHGDTCLADAFGSTSTWNVQSSPTISCLHAHTEAHAADVPCPSACNTPTCRRQQQCRLADKSCHPPVHTFTTGHSFAMQRPITHRSSTYLPQTVATPCWTPVAPTRPSWQRPRSPTAYRAWTAAVKAAALARQDRGGRRPAGSVRWHANPATDGAAAAAGPLTSKALAVARLSPPLASCSRP
eukprot:190204-Chlamydomonas_euryale.AAC.4